MLSHVTDPLKFGDNSLCIVVLHYLRTILERIVPLEFLSGKPLHSNLRRCPLGK